MDENTGVLRETTTGQETAEDQLNEETIPEAVTGDGA